MEIDYIKIAIFVTFCISIILPIVLYFVLDNNIKTRLLTKDIIESNDAFKQKIVDNLDPLIITETDFNTKMQNVITEDNFSSKVTSPMISSKLTPSVLTSLNTFATDGNNYENFKNAIKEIGKSNIGYMLDSKYSTKTEIEETLKTYAKKTDLSSYALTSSLSSYALSSSLSSYAKTSDLSLYVLISSLSSSNISTNFPHVVTQDVTVPDNIVVRKNVTEDLQKQINTLKSRMDNAEIITNKFVDWGSDYGLQINKLTVTDKVIFSGGGSLYGDGSGAVMYKGREV